jgi:hypothetical protein
MAFSSEIDHKGLESSGEKANGHAAENALTRCPASSSASRSLWTNSTARG